MLIGFIIGARIESNKRAKKRNHWLNNNGIINSEYEKNILLSFPLNKINTCLKMKKDFVLLRIEKKEVKLKNKKEFERLKSFLTQLESHK